MQHLTGVCRRCRRRMTSKAFVAIAIVTRRRPSMLTSPADRTRPSTNWPRVPSAHCHRYIDRPRPFVRPACDQVTLDGCPSGVTATTSRHSGHLATGRLPDEPADFICRSLLAQLMLHLVFFRRPSTVPTIRLSLQSHQLINEPSLTFLCVSVTEQSPCCLSFMYLGSKY